MAVREILRYPSVQSVTLVELDPAMTQLFRRDERLVSLNQRALLSNQSRSSTPTPSPGCLNTMKCLM